MDGGLTLLLNDYSSASNREGTLPDATLYLRSRNPICGDELTLDVALDADVISHARFTLRGCLVSRAFAAALCDIVIGRRIGDLCQVSFEALFEVDLSELSLARQSCAGLAFNVLKNGVRSRISQTSETSARTCSGLAVSVGHAGHE